MNEQEKSERFNEDLEAALEGQRAWRDAEEAGRMGISRRLASADFSTRSTRRVETRARVLADPGPPRRPNRLLRFARTAAAAAVLILAVTGISWLVLNLPVQPALPAAATDPVETSVPDAPSNPAGPLALEVIVFETDRDGNAEIYRMNGDGSDLFNLTRNPAEDTSPAWSPLGDRIAFFSDRTGKIELFSMDPDGGGLLQLTDEADIQWHGPIAWSPDGTALAVAGSPFVADENHAGLYLVYAESGIIGAPYTDVPVRSPLWLPDGSGLAIVAFDAEAASAAVYTLDLRTGEALDLTARLESAGSSAPYLIQGLAASPDGQRLAYLAYYRIPGADTGVLTSSIAAIQVYDRGRGTTETVLEITPIPNGMIGLDWSPDSRYLSFVQSVGMSGCWHVHVLRLADLEQTAAEGLCYLARTLLPDWTPDGGWLIYPADADGSDKVNALVAVDVAVLFEGRGVEAVHRITENDENARSPQVRPVREPVVRTTSEAEIEPAGPLTAESTDAEIRARLRESRLLWDTLWVDGRVEIESKGVVYIDRQQAWVDQPAQSRWLSGIEGAAPSLLQVQDGIHVLMVIVGGERIEFTAATPQVGELEIVLFPAHFANRAGMYEAVRVEEVAGRSALVAEWADDFGSVRERLWIDVETGLVLRWENLFPGAPDYTGQVPPSVIRIDVIAYDLSFPEGTFIPDQNVDTAFAERPGE